MISDLNIINIHDNSYNDLIKKLIEKNALQDDFDIQSELLEKIIFSYSEIAKQLDEKIEQVTLLSITDPLTQIYNRLKFNEEIEKLTNYVKRYESDLSLIMFDIDHFKKVNDNYGHDVGDLVLKEISSLVKNNIRNTDVFARWGGEEFILALFETDEKMAFDIAEKLRNLIEKHNFPKVKNITSSFGVCEYKKKYSTESFLKNVDLALYEAKNTGRNKVIIYK